MIPKLIHLCWLSGDPYPHKIQKCLDSWKKHLPDYEVMLWDCNQFDLKSSLWVEQAFAAKKLNPEKPDVPLNKNDAFQKVQKRRVQEKR